VTTSSIEIIDAGTMSAESFGSNAGDWSQADYDRVAKMIYEHCGITLQTGKEELVKARLAKRMRVLGLRRYQEYFKFVEQDATGREQQAMVDALTTNKTSFFREIAHFDFLRQRLLPQLAGQRVRIWSAGCSSGEEPYTLAMTLREHLPRCEASDVRVLATDLSRQILARAVEGTYSEETVRDVPRELLLKYFSVEGAPQSRLYRVGDVLRRMISFAPLNLLDDWPMNGPFDAIFCRNVMIYFDAPTRERLVRRYWSLLKPGGYLFVGLSESLIGVTHEFRYVQPGVHRKEPA
jgi:chemotaxis protein methyltransferase CheR